MDHSEPIVIRVLVAKGSDGQPHTYALAVDGLLLVDKASVRRIEASTQHAPSFLLVTDTGAIDITSEDLCMLISGRLWTEPTQGHRKVSRFVQTYSPPDKEERAYGAIRNENC